MSSVVCSVPAFYPAMRRWPRARLMHSHDALARAQIYDRSVRPRERMYMTVHLQCHVYVGYTLLWSVASKLLRKSVCTVLHACPRPECKSSHLETQIYNVDREAVKYFFLRLPDVDYIVTPWTNSKIDFLQRSRTRSVENYIVTIMTFYVCGRAIPTR